MSHTQQSEERKLASKFTGRVFGPGEMPGLIRNYNWHSTPLGPIETWPNELVSSVNLMLACAFPSLILWGAEMVQLYNDAFRPLIGEKHPECLGQPARQCWAEAWSIIGFQLHAVAERGETIFREGVLVPILRNGRMQDVYWNYSYSPIFDLEGDVSGILVVCQDVTKELSAVHHLKASEERASRILQSIGDAVIVTDTETRITHMNHVAESFIGLRSEEAAGRPLHEILHLVREGTKIPVENPAEKVRRLGIGVGYGTQTVFIRSDGTEIPIEGNGAPIRDPDGTLSGFVFVFRSVAERKRAAAALMQGEERLRLALAAARGVYIWDWDIENELSYSDPTYALLYGVDPGRAAAGGARAEFIRNIHPDDRERVQLLSQKAVRNGEEFSAEYRIIQADDTIRWVLAVGRCTYGADGRPLRLLGISLDITERKQMEEAMRESEARLHSIYSASLEYIGILNAEGKILDANRASLQFADSTHDEVVGIYFWEAPWFAYTPGMSEFIGTAVARAAEGEPFSTELALLRPSGETINFDFSLTPVFNREGKVTFIVPEARDITELKRAERALLQSEKIAAVGRLASSIAHEINNPLEAVTNLLFLARHAVAWPKVQEYLTAADHELRRVSVIANQTLRFHKQASSPQEVHADDLFSSVLGIYEARLRNSNITVEVSHRATQPVMCFEGDVRQVLNNLVGNAIDAMTSGGRMLIRSHMATDWVTNRKGLVLTVADTGLGMSPDVLSRIFEPFFTTKGIGGTGLGLWVSKEVVRRHEGVLRVRSSQRPPHHGSVFRLFLPFEGSAEIAAV
jgi:PAS domain S-box-containing protein